jgi:hypothetical protein
MSEIDEQIKNYPKCEDRINESFESRNDYIFGLLDAMDNSKSYDGWEDAYDCFHQFPLGISLEKTFSIKIELSWGGPSDYIEVLLEGNGEIIKAEYHFADWFDHASILIEKETAMYEYVVRLVEFFIETGGI